VVDVEGKRIVVYREPAANGYVSKFEFSAPSAISPKAFPDIEVAVRDIFA
jgi:Uma2 family endonuclease